MKLKVNIMTVFVKGWERLNLLMQVVFMAFRKNTILILVIHFSQCSVLLKCASIC